MSRCNKLCLSHHLENRPGWNWPSSVGHQMNTGMTDPILAAAIRAGLSSSRRSLLNQTMEHAAILRELSLSFSLSLCCRIQHHVATTVLFSLETRMECREALKTLGLVFVLQSWKYLTSLCNLRCSLSNGIFFVGFLPQTADLDLTLLSVLFCFLKAGNELFFQYLSAWIWQLVLQRASLAKFRHPSGSRPWPYSTTVSKERAKLPEGKKQAIPVEQELK